MDIGLQRRNSMLNTTMGPGILNLLESEDTIEIFRNPDSSIWVDRFCVGMVKTDIRQEEAEAQRMVELVASYKEGGFCNEKCPDVSAILPGYGYRFQGNVPPIVTGITWNIRKPTNYTIPLNKFVSDGVITQEEHDLLIARIKEKNNIMVIGGTSSGKTTLTNSLLQEIAKLGERLISIEDTPELKCPAENWVPMYTCNYRTMTDLLKNAMRMTPKRIVVGEVRDGSAAALLKAWNTGHPGGIATIHADSPLDGLIRMEDLIREANVVPVPRSIARAINLLVFIEPYDNAAGRKVTAIKEVEKTLSLSGEYQLKNIS